MPSSEPKELNSRHRLMMHSLVLEGLTVKETADKFDLSPEYLSNIRNSPLWKTEERKLTDDLVKGHRTRLQNLIPKAIDTLEQVMEQGYNVELANGEEKKIFNPPATRANAAGMILDRAGLGKGQEGEGNRPITIQLFQPPWSKDKGEVIEITVNGDQ